MGVGAVRIDLVDQHLEAERVGALEQAVEVGEGPEHRIDAAIIGDVVAEILHRRGEEGGQPEAVDAERGDMVEPVGDPRQVADPVAVRIGEAARIDLVDDGAAPPFGRLDGRGGADALQRARVHRIVLQTT
jgi:hypothetical protein